jgi:hypothetical protein
MSKISEYDVITQDDLLSDKELYSEIVTLLGKREEESRSFVEQKRQLFDERNSKLTNPSVFKKKNYIKIHTAIQQKKAFVATFLDAEMSVSFTGRELADDDFAYNLELAADYFTEASNKKFRDRQWLDDIAFYGVGIRIKTGYNTNTNMVEYVLARPDGWLPDVNANYEENNYRYHMFEMTTTKQELDMKAKRYPDKYFNLDKVQAGARKNDYREKQQDDRELTGTMGMQDRVYSMSCYIQLGLNKYQLTTTNDNSNIIRWEYIEPISKEEKKDPTLIPFPVNITNVHPIYGDPFGLGIVEMVLDKQNAINRLYNLSIIKEQKNAGFGKYLVDTSVLPNLNWLEMPSDE